MVPAPAHSTSVFMETCLASLWMLLFCSLWTPTEKQNTLLGEIQLLPALIIQFYLNSLNPFRKTLLKLENIYIYICICVCVHIYMCMYTYTCLKITCSRRWSAVFSPNFCLQIVIMHLYVVWMTLLKVLYCCCQRDGPLAALRLE